MNHSVRKSGLLGVVSMAALAGCAARSAGPAAVIRATLERQTEAWNVGDIPAFMAAYWRSPDLTFSSGGRVTRGWQETLDGYRRRYPDRTAMGLLTFSELEVQELAHGVALVLGRWHLDRENPVGGAFSLVLKEKAGRWLIVHDHTSVGEP